MAAPSSHDHLEKQYLPPHRKKKSDPFEELAAAPVPSPPSSPPNELADEGSLLTKIILTPLYFISFLFSLFLVNYRDRARRTDAHSSRSFLSYFYPSTWLDPEPYQDPDDSTWGSRGSAGHFEPNEAIGPRKDAQSERGKKKSWHLHRKIRKVARLEISDAFEMRGKIIAGILVGVVLCSVVMWYGMRWVLRSLSARLFRSR